MRSRRALRTLLLCLALSAMPVLSLRVMTFNTWYTGAMVQSGLKKVAKHIKAIDPDVVCLQEVTSPNVYNRLMQILGPPWRGVYRNQAHPDMAVITKHEILQTYQASVGVGARIKLNSVNEFVVWSVHLEYRYYGPYIAQRRRASRSNILFGENRHGGRVSNSIELTTNEDIIAAADNSYWTPLIIAGDFNTPSDLDWIPENRHLHNNWVIEWPSPKILREGLEMMDAWRTVYPDPINQPGITWSTTLKTPEPQDRIDHIYYAGSVEPWAAYIYAGNETLNLQPFHRSNDFPSDHFAVVVDFYRAYKSRRKLQRRQRKQ